MNKYSIVFKHSVFINKPREQVWDYTQNYGNRALWDSSVKDAYIIQVKPYRIIKLKMKGNATMTFIYKQDDRPYKTSLVASEIQSQFIESAGGSWTYEDFEKGTKWTQKNTIQIKPKRWVSLIMPLLKWMFKKQTIESMNRAKQLLETN